MHAVLFSAFALPRDEAQRLCNGAVAEFIAGLCFGAIVVCDTIRKRLALLPATLLLTSCCTRSSPLPRSLVRFMARSVINLWVVANAQLVSSNV